MAEFEEDENGESFLQREKRHHAAPTHKEEMKTNGEQLVQLFHIAQTRQNESSRQKSGGAEDSFSFERSLRRQLQHFTQGRDCYDDVSSGLSPH